MVLGLLTGGFCCVSEPSTQDFLVSLGRRPASEPISLPLWFFSCCALLLPGPVCYHVGDPEQQSEVKSGGWLTSVVERRNVF